MKSDLHNAIDEGCLIYENWKQAVEAAVKKIIAKYYQTSPSRRSAALLLKIAEQTWKRIDENLFDSLAHYYIVLAKMLDHLLRFLHPLRDGNGRPFLLFERMEYVSKPLKAKIILDIDVGYLENGGYTIRKFMLEEDEQFQNIYKQAALIICKEVFQKLPVKIEFYSLLNGTCNVGLWGLTPTALKC
ncbi:hypothetical protein [Bacillus alveayuensis]|jgi:hypothetical protein|uniref:hypothetical protein n=1 Tax=Aeribacillus alveayuensis TaxID=279215 RepID=UPI0005D10CBA|nr:hypothetical protein [Bacillus alveayuensis]